MLVPKSGPKLRDLSRDESITQRFAKAVADRGYRVFVEQAINEGWNWEDCTHRAKAAGIDAETAWLSVKLLRNTNRSQVPLQDTSKKQFTVSLPPVAHRMLHQIDLFLGGQIGTDKPMLDTEASRSRYLLSSLREEAISSSLIEGAVVTRRDAKELIRSGRKPRTVHERMIVNNYRTIQMLNRRCRDPMTPDLLCEVQRMLTEGTLSDPGEAGRFRRDDESVHVHDEESNEPLYFPPPAGELLRRMEDFCRFANEPADAEPFIHPVVRAIVLHFWIGYDHPFVDGNGRTARAMFYWSMLRSGYWLTEYLTISTIIHQQPKQYYRAFLDTELDENDLMYFLLYHLKVIIRSMDEFRSYLRKQQQESEQVHALAMHDLNERKQQIVLRALRDPTTAFTHESHAQSHDIVIATARSDLLDLVKRGLLRQVRGGRAFRYVAVPDLADRLERRKGRRARPG